MRRTAAFYNAVYAFPEPDAAGTSPGTSRGHSGIRLPVNQAVRGNQVSMGRGEHSSEFPLGAATVCGRTIPLKKFARVPAYAARAPPGAERSSARQHAVRQDTACSAISIATASGGRWREPLKMHAAPATLVRVADC